MSVCSEAVVRQGGLAGRGHLAGKPTVLCEQPQHGAWGQPLPMALAHPSAVEGPSQPPPDPLPPPGQRCGSAIAAPPQDTASASTPSLGSRGLMSLPQGSLFPPARATRETLFGFLPCLPQAFSRAQGGPQTGARSCHVWDSCGGLSLPTPPALGLKGETSHSPTLPSGRWGFRPCSCSTDGARVGQATRRSRTAPSPRSPWDGRDGCRGGCLLLSVLLADGQDGAGVLVGVPGGLNRNTRSPGRAASCRTFSQTPDSPLRPSSPAPLLRHSWSCRGRPASPPTAALASRALRKEDTSPVSWQCRLLTSVCAGMSTAPGLWPLSRPCSPHRPARPPRVRWHQGVLSISSSSWNVTL